MSTRSSTLRVAEPPRAPTVAAEHRHSFECFGGHCTVIVADARRPADAAAAAAMAKRTLLQWHEQFSRFAPGSELTRLNRDARSQVPVSPLMRRVIEAALTAADDTGGLVDATLGSEIERAGYAAHFEGDGIGLAAALSWAPPRAAAGGEPAQRWRQITVDRRLGVVNRPAGTNIDPGGIAKGVFADELATLLSGFDAYALDCAGDVRLGGSAGLLRDVHVASPFNESTLHTFALRCGAVATSGIGKRSWRRPDGRPAHHLLNPRTGEPAFTGIVQATALAPTAVKAEALAKAAVLSGPEHAAAWLPHGGVVVGDDGGYTVLEPAADTAAPAGTRSRSQAQRSASTSSRSGSLRISW